MGRCMEKVKNHRYRQTLFRFRILIRNFSIVVLVSCFWSKSLYSHFSNRDRNAKELESGVGNFGKV